LVLYDLTSVYFEGKGPDHMARYGYSRDHRTDRPQILLAVATDSKGVPLHVEVLRGNRADNATLIGLLSNLRRRFGIREATFVFDGGMSSRLNLEAMDADQLRYITRLSTTSLRSLVEQLPEEKQLELGDRAKLIEVTHQDKRYVIAGGCWRQQRDFQRRELRMQKARKELERLAKIKRKKPDAQKLTSQVARALQRLKAHKYFTYQVDANGQLQWSTKNELIEQEERLDGWYLLHTNQSQQRCDSKQTLEHYKGLLEVEEAFCQIKSYLEVRPIFHWRPDRVRNHVRLCFLAYWLSARLARQWQGCQESGEVPRILRELQTIRVGFIKLSEQSVKPMLARIPENLNKLLVKLKLLILFNGPPRWANL
jgi:transposase